MEISEREWNGLIARIERGEEKHDELAKGHQELARMVDRITSWTALAPWVGLTVAALSALYTIMGGPK